MKVWVVNLEWNEPPSEVAGDPGIIGVYATREGAENADRLERARLHADGYIVYQYSYADEAHCVLCGEEAPRNDKGEPMDCPCPMDDSPDVRFCGNCGAELNDRGECDADHDAWDVDVHGNAFDVLELPAPADPPADPPVIAPSQCPYCSGPYTLDAGGCVAHCAESVRVAQLIQDAHEADITEQDEVEGRDR